MNLPNLPNLHLSKLRTREHQVAKHQSLSHVLVKPCRRPSSSAALESLGLPCSVLVHPQLSSVLNRVMVPMMTTLNQPVCRGPLMARTVPSSNQHSRPVNVGKSNDCMTMTTMGMKPTPRKGGSLTQPHTIINDCNPTHQYLVCYECGQTGHIKPNCPKIKGSV